MADERTLDALRAMAREQPLEIRVRGSCMAPLLADGTPVAVTPARVYWPGDVVVFQAADGRLLAHRLLGYRRLGGRLACVTQGDGCLRPDAPVPLDRILGRAAGAGLLGRLQAVATWLRLALRRLLRR
jgi:hypothetical protein